MDNVRDHLRGFSRTIPSFLMAYGDENTTLGNFDQIIPDKDIKIDKHNLKLFDSLPFAQDGTLEQKLDEVFRD